MSTVINMVGAGGGGESLRFNVYGYAEEKTEPGALNDIQVYPADDMTGFCVQFNEPNAKTGLVWLKTGNGRYEMKLTDSEEVYLPVADAKIYRNGAWESVTTKLYDGTGWVPSVFVLYSNGSNKANFARVSGGTAVFNDSDLTMNSYCVIQSGKVVTDMRNSVTLKFDSTFNAANVEFKFIIKNGSQSRSFSTSLDSFTFDGLRYGNSYLFDSINVSPYNLWDLYVEITNNTGGAIKLKEVYFE